MANTFEVFSPVSGTAIALSQVPDPVFSEKMLGDGVAVDPSDNTLVAPFDGKVMTLNKNLHAVTLSNGTVEVLFHIGLETVQLKGQGFKALVAAGDNVKKGQALIEFDKDFIVKNAPSAWVMCVLTSPMDVAVKAVSGKVKKGEVLFSVPTSQTVQSDSDNAAENVVTSAPIVITNPNGLHARPAGMLARAAKDFPFQITLHKGNNSCDAKSVVGIMGLALNAQDSVVLQAHTIDAAAAQKALDTLRELILSGLGETVGTSRPATAPVPDELIPTVPVQKGVFVKGLAACSGLAEGKTFLFKHEEVSFTENSSQPQEEKVMFEDCLLVLSQQLEQEIKNAANKNAKAIAGAHLEMLQDPFLTQETLRTIEQGKTAAYSFNEAVRRSIDLLRQTGSRFLKERIADFKDLRRRMILLLNGQPEPSYHFTPGTIILAEDLLPSDVAHFGKEVAGVVMTLGSPTAHVSILLRNRNIPTLVNTHARLEDIPNATPIFIDGAQGAFIINPDAHQASVLHQRCEQARAQEQADREHRHLPAVTKDGTKIEVGGNINNCEDARNALENGADSLGLVRTEFLFLQETQAPSYEKQSQQYKEIVGAMQGRPVTLRTLDIGGDKPVRYLTIAPEENPMLGLRGVRIYDDNIEIFRTQVRAMLSVQPVRALRIMLPMVGTVEQMRHFRQIIEEEKKKAGVKEPVMIGMMVEIPAAALMAEQFAPVADFFSIGTNDLTQYTLAIDRGHKVLSAQADGLSPAVLQLIAQTCKGAQTCGRPVAVCGAMAGDLQAVALLIGLGVRELAVGSGAIAQVKALVCRLNLAQCQQAAAQALRLEDAAQVREFVRKTFQI